ncbi:MAG: CoA transferase [Chloroflexi bacterium]|nr:CoA transferase [Chloroflexota bacterium]
MSGTLEGLKVVSMEQWVVIPHASVLLADWGADVIKVEPLTGEPFRGTGRVGGVSTNVKLGNVELKPGFQLLNRNKKSLAVDLKKETGRDIFCQLIRQADVFMSNYQLDALKKLRLDYDSLSQVNPRLIYAVVSGYGSRGPDRDEQAFDVVASWARSGMAYLITDPGNPPARQPAGMGDRTASVHVVAGILSALLHREKTGKGQELEFSLLHSALWTISWEIQDALVGAPLRRDIRTRAQNPLQNTYRTSDNRWLQLMMPQSQVFWSGFCRAIDRPELENDPRFHNIETRTQHCEELIRILDEIFASKTIDEWEALCRKYRLIYSRIKTPAEVIVDPQALANDCFVDLPHPAGTMKVIASPVKFRQNPASVKTPAPEVGQHTEDILLELGYSWEDIGRFKEQGVIL